MTTPGQPDRIQQAKRARGRNRLVGHGVPEAQVNATLEAWTAGDHRDLHAGDYWQRPHDWIAIEQAAGRRSADQTG